LEICPFVGFLAHRTGAKPYLVNFAFWAFSEVGLPIYGVLRSSLLASNAQATTKIAHLSDTYDSIREYAAFVAWPAEMPREGAGQLPALFPEKGSLPSSYQQATEENRICS
jgi:hypothetical protein